MIKLNVAPRAAARLAVPIALIVATALVVVLAVQNRLLRARYAELVERATLPHPGLVLPTFEAVTLAGERVTIGHTPPDESQLLFVFNTTCPYCQVSLPAWNEIARSVGSRGRGQVAVYGISLDPPAATAAYADKYGLTFPVVTFPEPKLTELYRARVVPLVLVLDSVGRVVLSRAGVLASKPAVDSVLAVLQQEGPKAADHFGPSHGRDLVRLGGRVRAAAKPRPRVRSTSNS